MNKTPKFDLARVSSLIPGMSTKADVVNLLGKNFTQSPLQDGEMLTYKYSGGMETHLTSGAKAYDDYVAVVLKGGIVQERFILRDQTKTMCVISVCDSSTQKIKIPLEQYQVNP